MSEVKGLHLDCLENYTICENSTSDLKYKPFASSNNKIYSDKKIRCL